MLYKKKNEGMYLGMLCSSLIAIFNTHWLTLVELLLVAEFITTSQLISYSQIINPFMLQVNDNC